MSSSNAQTVFVHLYYYSTFQKPSSRPPHFVDVVGEKLHFLDGFVFGERVYCVEGFINVDAIIDGAQKTIGPFRGRFSASVASSRGRCVVYLCFWGPKLGSLLLLSYWGWFSYLGLRQNSSCKY